jgi:hypothetical protein
MRTLKLIPILVVPLVVVAAAKPASATHKNWQLKNSGSQCFFTSYPSNFPPWGNHEIANLLDTAQYAVCPVTLAARWGSSASSAFPVPRWAAAMSAKAVIVNNNTNGSVFDCLGRARLSTQSIYFSQRATTTTTGPQALIVLSSSNWGGTLEAMETNQLKSLDLDCRIPGVPTQGSPSSIQGYQVKICQQLQQCDDGEGPTHEGYPLGGPDTDGDYAYVQTSGFECMVADYNEADHVQRSYAGITNTASYGFGVFCPLTQPADDSWFHQRTMDETRVYYRNPNGGTPANPSCVISARSHTTLYVLQDLGSNDLVPQTGTDYVQQPTNAFPVGLDVTVGVWCDLWPGQTLKGVTSRMSLTAISGGI